MKDINFEEIEKYILIRKEEVERLRICAKTDAGFLNEMSIMDYSLFVVKISINREEVYFNYSDESSIWNKKFY